jgi:hypothetical protein
LVRPLDRQAAQQILCPGHGFEVFGRRYSASMHIRRIIERTLSRVMTTPSHTLSHNRGAARPWPVTKLNTSVAYPVRHPQRATLS